MIVCKWFSVILLSLLGLGILGNAKSQLCFRNDTLILFDRSVCPSFLLPDNPKRPIYILYDINPQEGFNLRRDVYIRLAVFIKHAKRREEFRDVRLVLPPFRRLYHWKSNMIDQENIPWRHFFDVASLRKFTAVLDYDEFLEELSVFATGRKDVRIDHTLQLSHFEDMFENGVFRDKFEFADCSRPNKHPGAFLGQRQLITSKFGCLKFQGSANMLESVISNLLKKDSCANWFPKIYLFLNAEIVLHEHWGGREFWQARRSMRFAKHLVKIANDFREYHFSSTDAADLVQRPFDWRHEKPYSKARGGEYLCFHLRRGDFLQGREKSTPTLKSAANQIKTKLHNLNLSKVFLSSDCTQFEFKNLRAFLPRVDLIKFSTNSFEQKAFLKDGGIAIIDQIVCSHARHFVGTYESTFTYRIYEEREIMGFMKAATFNTLCKQDNLSNCLKNSFWPIVY